MVMARGRFGANGLSWEEARLVEDDPTAGYCYPAFLSLGDGTALLAYCAGAATTGDQGCLVRTRVRRVELG